MGHPSLLVQDYIAGIPIWYIPNTIRANGHSKQILQMEKMHAITNGQDHQKVTGEIDTVAKGEDPATMTTMVLTVK
jgi:hypothetical protein